MTPALCFVLLFCGAPLAFAMASTGPTSAPVAEPTIAPTIAPTSWSDEPSPAPTAVPTIAPTSPTSIPTEAPTPLPTAAPSTSAPTFQLLVCDPGQYTIQSQDVPPVAVECYDCPIGKYSPYGNVTVCATCSVGWSSPRKSADCVPCTAGWTSTAGGACTACPVGSYSAYGDTSCRVCAIGTYSNAAHSANCSSCAIGYYTATTNSTNCSRCEDGYTTSGVGATSCAPCAAGSYSSYNVTGLVCRQCPANTYTASAATVTCTACQFPAPYNSANSTACTDTSVAPSAAPTAAPTLHECDLGSYTSSNGACAQCAAGYFTNTATATVCSGCQVGTYAPLPGLSACWSCMPGTIGVSSFATTCVNCAAGTFSGSQQMTQCSSCVAGFYAPEVASAACATCPAGKYQNATGASACVTCPSSAPFNTQDRTACASVTAVPTATPTASPTAGLQQGQTWTPTQYPTRPPTRTPTIAPSAAPTSLPSAAPSRAPTTAAPSYAPTVAPTISFPDSANLTGATIAAAGGVAADADLTNGTGFVPGAGWTALSALGLSVMNLHPTQSIVITQVAAFSDTELRAYYTSTTVHSGSCGALPASASRPVAMFHVTSTTPTTIQARLSITLGDIGYTHPGRVLYLCNATTGNNGSWVVASAFVNGTGANYTDDQTTSGRDVVFATAIGHNTAYVLADDTAQDGGALCADGYHGCKCYSQHAMEEGRTSSAFLVIAAVLWGLAILARRASAEGWVSAACTIAWLVANVFVTVSVATRTSDRDPRQWVADKADEWWTVFVLMVVVPLCAIALILLLERALCWTGSSFFSVPDRVDGAGGARKPQEAPALTSGAITLASTLLGLLVIISPSAHYSGGKGLGDANFQSLFAVSTVAVAIGLEMLVAALQTLLGYRREDKCNVIDWLMLFTMVIDLVAVVYISYILALVPCGNTPQF